MVKFMHLQNRTIWKSSVENGPFEMVPRTNDFINKHNLDNNLNA